MSYPNDQGNPAGAIPVYDTAAGGVFNTAPETLTNGERGDLQLDNQQNLLTNARWSRPTPVEGSFTPGSASYTANQLIGPAGATAALSVVVDAALAGQYVKITRVSVNALADAIAAGEALVPVIAEGGLAGSYPNGAVAAYTAPDLAKTFYFGSSMGGPITATNAILAAAPAAPLSVLLDNDGAFELLISSSGVFTMTAPGVWNYRVEVMK